MAFNPLKTIWRQRIARAGVGLLVLAGAAFGQYKLANIPRPVDLETVEIFSPATVNLGKQELVIEGPVVAEGVLFSYGGKSNETVDAHYDRARLDDETISLFEDIGFKPPSTPTTIDYQAQEPKQPAIGDETCQTGVTLHAISQMPTEIHLFQVGESGQEHFRRLELMTKGADLVSDLVTAPPGDSDRAPGCQKLLRVGDWKQSPPLGLTVIADEGSTLRFDFKQVKAGTILWGDATGFHEPFDLGSPQLSPTDPVPFQARAVSIRQLGRGDSTVAQPDLASVTSDGQPLTISGLRIGSDQLQLTVAGRGWVKINGVDKTDNVLKRVSENLTVSMLLTAFNTALIAWVARLILKRPSRSPQHKGPQERDRSHKAGRRRKRGAKK